MLIRAIAICIGLVAAVPASAQSAPPASQPTPPPASSTIPEPAAPLTPPPPPSEGDDSRYTFNRVQDGYLRLDVRTGQVALCSRRQIGWACQVLPDDRIVLESEIARLQSENGALKKELLSRGIGLPSGVKPPQSAKQAEPAPKSEESNVDRALAMVQTMWRRLVEMIGNLQRDIMDRS